MGKIRVQDLARMIGMQDQDLMFKLRSIGVRVEGKDAQVDTEVLKAVLEGKRLTAPREVIVRDEPEPAPPSPTAPPRRAPGPPGRRMPPPPPRPRPRTQIHKVEPRIQTLPPTARPKGRPSEEAPALQVAATAVESPAPAGPPTAPPPAAVVEPAATGHATPAARPAPAREEKKPAGKDKARPRRREEEVEEEDLRALRGKVDEDELEEAAAPAAAGPSRRKRREQRKEAAGTPGAETSRPQLDGPVTIVEGMTVRDFAEKLDIKSKDLIKRLLDRGMFANINHVLEAELAEELARELGVETMVVSFEEEVQLKQGAAFELGREKGAGKVPRAPVVTIMGHVDHGKTTLLDGIRESRLVDAEHGGITQHIAAYQVVKGGRKMVFLDTPGHEAFTKLRARGARATDLVILVVAADDGVMPQTIEAIDHARAAKVPIVVAVNKIDKANANPDRVKKELADRGLQPEDWGGDTVMVHVSALKKEGIAELLEMLLLTADLLELKGNPELPAQGAIIEARKEVGRGIIATVLVQDGTLRVGDVFVAGATWGRVRSMVDDLGHRVLEAPPATPVEVTGFQEVPDAGDLFQCVADEVRARSIAEFRQQEQRRRELTPTQGRVSLEQLFSKIEQGEIKDLAVVVKADVQGSVEVLQDTLAKMSTEKVRVNVLHASVGAITTNDVLLASASGAVVIGFNVRPERNATELAAREGVDIRLHTIIYELTDELKKAMTGLLEPTFQEVTRGRAEVRDTFKIPRIGVVAGCHVVEGVIPRNASARILRDNMVVHEGKIGSLRRFKDDVSEVRTGFDCGIGIDRYQDVKPGDIIEAYGREEVAQTL